MRDVLHSVAVELITPVACCQHKSNWVWSLRNSEKTQVFLQLPDQGLQYELPAVCFQLALAEFQVRRAQAARTSNPSGMPDYAQQLTSASTSNNAQHCHLVADLVDDGLLERRSGAKRGRPVVRHGRRSEDLTDNRYNDAWRRCGSTGKS
jgi:hypothetical protein